MSLLSMSDDPRVVQAMMLDGLRERLREARGPGAPEFWETVTDLTGTESEITVEYARIWAFKLSVLGTKVEITFPPGLLDQDLVHDSEPQRTSRGTFIRKIQLTTKLDDPAQEVNIKWSSDGVCSCSIDPGRYLRDEPVRLAVRRLLLLALARVLLSLGAV